jgi:hypothetical protein
MTEAEGQGQGNGIPADIRTDIPHPARVYDYWLGGKDNFPADREMAEWVLKLTPETLDTVRANRQWMVRAIRFLCDAVSHGTRTGELPDPVSRHGRIRPERTHEASAGAAQRGAIWIPRGKDAILRMFNGLELLDPGLVLVSYWRPEGGVQIRTPLGPGSTVASPGREIPTPRPQRWRPVSGALRSARSPAFPRTDGNL